MLGTLKARKGVRVQGPLVTLIGAGANNAQAIFQVSNYAPQIGVRSFRIERIKGLNQAGVNTLIHIGTGLTVGTWADIMPPLFTNNGLNFDFVEGDLPEVEIGVDMTAYAVFAGALTPVYIQVEVEELG